MCLQEQNMAIRYNMKAWAIMDTQDTLGVIYYVQIRVIKNRSWQRDQDNLITKKPINVFDLLLGCVIIITTLDNKKLELKIPQGTKPGAKFSIPGYGLPNMQTRQRGNFL